MAQSLSQLLECTICNEPFDDDRRKPKILPCYHTFCLACLKRMSYKAQSPLKTSRCATAYSSSDKKNMQIKCPNDNKIFDVPSNDVTKLSNDFTMMSLLDQAKPIKSYSRGKDIDIKIALSQRVEALERDISDMKKHFEEIPLPIQDTIKQVRENINFDCQKMIDRFTTAVQERKAILLQEVDSFEQQETSARNEDSTVQLEEATAFCDEVKSNMSWYWEKRVTEKLQECLNLKDKMKSSYENLKSPESNPEDPVVQYYQMHWDQWTFDTIKSIEEGGYLYLEFRNSNSASYSDEYEGSGHEDGREYDEDYD